MEEISRGKDRLDLSRLVSDFLGSLTPMGDVPFEERCFFLSLYGRMISTKCQLPKEKGRHVRSVGGYQLMEGYPK